MKKAYRKGALGAMMDEYERAASELKRLVEQIPDDEFVRIVDPQTSNENCRSVQTIMAHVVSAGYGYADHIRQVFSISSTRPPKRLLSRQEAVAQLESMLEYTAQTLEGRWEMTDEQIESITIHSRWEVTYNLEQLLEHAIVHILRHRRQVEKFMRQDKIATQSDI
ncbi:MAG: DinB family protein [bacterium]